MLLTSLTLHAFAAFKATGLTLSRPFNTYDHAKDEERSLVAHRSSKDKRSVALLIMPGKALLAQAIGKIVSLPHGKTSCSVWHARHFAGSEVTYRTLLCHLTRSDSLVHTLILSPVSRIQTLSGSSARPRIHTAPVVPSLLSTHIFTKIPYYSLFHRIEPHRRMLLLPDKYQDKPEDVKRIRRSGLRYKGTGWRARQGSQCSCEIRAGIWQNLLRSTCLFQSNSSPSQLLYSHSTRPLLLLLIHSLQRLIQTQSLPRRGSLLSRNCSTPF